jgi:diguanylate cyclase (GGDEF)-like protein/putative nucleotidyltransferase with HDIG domain
MRETLVSTLGSAGYTPRFASSLCEFWRCIAESPPDIVLIPDELEDVRGPELCGEIRMRQSTRHLAIVVVARSESDERFVVRSLRAGADDAVCLDRPAELGARVAAQLRNYRYRRMLSEVRTERDVLRVVATRDALTRIANRGTLDRTMGERVERGLPFGLLFIDIDHFKSVNDTFGHDVGDEVLRRIARYLERGVRLNDFCGRYGGEEFVVIVDGAGEELAAKVAERHCRAISAITFGPRGPDHPVTVSVGVAAYDPSSDTSLETTLRRADEALYRAKRAGRNQVVVASTIPPAEDTSGAWQATPITAAESMGVPVAGDVLAEVEKALVRALESKSVSLPVLPEIAAQALSLANDPNANLQRFAGLVDRDPHIAARFLSIANSVVYSRGFKTTSTGAAVVRVGLQGARDILFQAVYSASIVGLPRYQQAVGKSFHRSVLAAVAAMRAVGSFGSFPYAYLAGLLHDIGEARVYRILASLPWELTEVQAMSLVARHHCRAGVELAEAWNLPPEIVKVCRNHHDPTDETMPIRLVRLSDAVVDQLVPRTDERVAETDEWYEPFGLSAPQAQKLLEDVSSAAKELEPADGRAAPTARRSGRVPMRNLVVRG